MAQDMIDNIENDFDPEKIKPVTNAFDEIDALSEDKEIEKKAIARLLDNGEKFSNDSDCAPDNISHTEFSDSGVEISDGDGIGDVED